MNSPKTLLKLWLAKQMSVVKDLFESLAYIYSYPFLRFYCLIAIFGRFLVTMLLLD